MQLSKEKLGLVTDAWSLNAAITNARLLFRKLYNNSTVFHYYNLKERLPLQSLLILADMPYCIGALSKKCG